MTTSQNAYRIHPLVAVAAISVTLVSALGIAAITGVLPNSHGLTAEPPHASAEIVTESKPSVQIGSAGSIKQKPSQHNAAQHTASNTPSQPASQVAKNEPAATAPLPAAKPAPQNSPIGIGVGAVIGGVLGNQVGSGSGKTLATIAGAIGGGYIGNEVAKKNQ